MPLQASLSAHFTEQQTEASGSQRPALSHPNRSPISDKPSRHSGTPELALDLQQGKGGFSCSSVGKEPARNAGDQGLIPGWGISPGEENGNPLQYSCLEKPMDRGAWWAKVHGVTKSQTRLSSQHFTAGLRALVCLTLSGWDHPALPSVTPWRWPLQQER